MKQPNANGNIMLTKNKYVEIPLVAGREATIKRLGTLLATLPDQSKCMESRQKAYVMHLKRLTQTATLNRTYRGEISRVVSTK